MIGPKSEVAKLEAFATELDRQLCGAVGINYVADASNSQRGYEVLELKYIEPMVAEFDLKNRIRGLHVTVVPDPVTPGITGEDEGKKAEDPQTAGQGQGKRRVKVKARAAVPVRVVVAVRAAKPNCDARLVANRCAWWCAARRTRSNRPRLTWL